LALTEARNSDGARRSVTGAREVPEPHDDSGTTRVNPNWPLVATWPHRGRAVAQARPGRHAPPSRAFRSVGRFGVRETASVRVIVAGRSSGRRPCASTARLVDESAGIPRFVDTRAFRAPHRHARVASSFRGDLAFTTIRLANRETAGRARPEPLRHRIERASVHARASNSPQVIRRDPETLAFVAMSAARASCGKFATRARVVPQLGQRRQTCATGRLAVIVLRQTCRGASSSWGPVPFDTSPSTSASRDSHRRHSATAPRYIMLAPRGRAFVATRRRTCRPRGRERAPAQCKRLHARERGSVQPA